MQFGLGLVRESAEGPKASKEFVNLSVQQMVVVLELGQMLSDRLWGSCPFLGRKRNAPCLFTARGFRL